MDLKRIVGVVVLLSILITGCSNNPEEGNGSVVDSSSVSVTTTSETMSVTINESTETEVETMQTSCMDETLVVEMYEAYYDALINIMNNQQLPDSDYVLEFTAGFYNVSDNVFAIADIDLDGKDELLVHWKTTSMAGMQYRIYEYDPINDIWINELQGSWTPVFYDNGVITVDSLHNQGYAETIWPYGIEIYNAETDSYEDLGWVDCWDRAFTDANYPEVQFPEEYDTDDAGVVYMIYVDGFDHEYYSQSEYDEFRFSIIGDASEISVEYYPLTEENIVSITGVS